VDHVFVAMEAQSFQAANRNQFYVSVSRGCEQVRIFTNDVEFLRMVVNKPGARMSAIELLESARRGEKEAIQQRPALKMAAGV